MPSDRFVVADANAKPLELLHICRGIICIYKTQTFPLRKPPIAQAKLAFKNDRNVDTMHHQFVTFVHAFLAFSLAHSPGLQNPHSHRNSLAFPLYSPFNFSCTTLNATSSKSISSFMWLAFKPVATLALGFLPAYITCLRS